MTSFTRGIAENVLNANRNKFNQFFAYLTFPSILYSTSNSIGYKKEGLPVILCIREDTFFLKHKDEKPPK